MLIFRKKCTEFVQTIVEAVEKTKKP